MENSVCEIEPWRFDAEDNHAFRIFYGAQTWDDAQARCVSAGGHLATIGADRSQVLLAALSHTEVWIGARRSGGDTFVWVIDDEPFDYTNWASGEPGADDCAVMTALSGQWRTADCGETKAFVCEID